MSETIGEAPNPNTNAMTAKEIDIYTIDSPSSLVLMEGAMPDNYQTQVDIFDGEKAVTTLPNLHKHNDFGIDLDPAKPFLKPSRPYHMNQEECAECRKVLDEMLKARWAEPANANCLMVAPMFFVWKKDGSCQPVINCWKLNKITIKDSYPLPCIDEMMDRIRRLKIFMKLNLKSGYNQIQIQPGDKWKMTFMTPFGLFQLRVMTFGFTNAPPCFQQYMNKVLGPVLYRNIQ